VLRPSLEAVLYGQLAVKDMSKLLRRTSTAFLPGTLSPAPTTNPKPALYRYTPNSYVIQFLPKANPLDRLDGGVGCSGRRVAFAEFAPVLIWTPSSQERV
jgi:hypothetical protein